jgi:hypothetical protein
MINLFSLLLIFLFRFEFLIWKDRRELSLWKTQSKYKEQFMTWRRRN